MMPRGAVRTSLVSVVAFAVAALIGRQAVLSGTELALVWPAAGIAAVWVAAHAPHRWVGVDCVLLFAASAAVNGATGVSTALAVGAGLASVVQAVVAMAVLRRWAPQLTGFADDPPRGLASGREFGLLLAAAAAGSIASALIGPATVLAARDQDWAVLASWMVRNTTGVVAVFPLALAFPALVRRGSRGVARSLSRGRWLEVAALVVATGLTLWFVFDVDHDLPLPFVVLAACVWAGARFGPQLAGTWTVLLVTAVVVLTLRGHGPFATIEVGYEQALVIQTFVLVVVLVTLFLSVSHRENVLLNAALVASERAARDQARLVQTIVDSMADGVSVVDDTGRIVLRNPAALRLLGDPHLDADGVVAPAAYSFMHADGSKVQPDDTPYALAEARQEVVRDDYLLRAAAAPDRWLDVTATPLAGTGAPGSALVVVVYHDVTAERRERDELAAFAGVVAHDLLNPLTVVEGWTTTMTEELVRDATPEPGTQLHHLDRIQRAGRRMRNLIDDLLAYTTARDQAIDPVPVDTTELVRDVAQVRVEAATASEDVEPRIVVGDLPAVLAEPVLLRQVLDNLIGNSIKYVAPGVRPLVEVTGRLVADGPGPAEPVAEPVAELVVSDNGIGIPAGQHASVFETFHRAHRAGYRGTGLGLSIVKRIVERHGGSVTAADRPGGGTAITVRLPAAEQDALYTARDARPDLGAVQVGRRREAPCQ